MQRVVITGSSGYIGSRLVRFFRQKGIQTLGIDIVAADSIYEPDQFCQLDILSEELAQPIEAFQPDALIHAAFIVEPIRDRKKMHQVNVGGTRNVFDLVARSSIQQLMVVSSATCYGAWPDNKIPMKEDHPRRQRKEFQYASDKWLIEKELEAFAQDHPDRCISALRPTIVAGPEMDNYIIQYIFGVPMMGRMGGEDTTLQFVHVDDVVRAAGFVLENQLSGPFNVSPTDWQTVTEVAAETGRRSIYLPFWLARAVHGLMWAMRLKFHRSPASFLYFARYPWVIHPQRLIDEGFEFEHSSLEVLRMLNSERNPG